MANSEQQNWETKKAWAADPKTASEFFSDNDKAPVTWAYDPQALSKFLSESISHLEETTEEPEFASTAPELRKIQEKRKSSQEPEEPQQDEVIEVEQHDVILHEASTLMVSIETESETMLSEQQSDDDRYVAAEVSVTSIIEETAEPALTEEPHTETEHDSDEEAEDADDAEDIEQEADDTIEDDGSSILSDVALKISVAHLSSTTHFKRPEQIKEQRVLKAQLCQHLEALATSEEDSHNLLHCLAHFLYQNNYLELFQIVSQSMSASYQNVLTCAKSMEQLQKNIDCYFQEKGTYKNKKAIIKIIDDLLALFQLWSVTNNNNHQCEAPDCFEQLRDLIPSQTTLLRGF